MQTSLARLALLSLAAGCTTATRAQAPCQLVRTADSRAPFPRYGAGAVSDGRHVYVAAGTGVSGEHGRIDRFDPSTGFWSVVVDHLASRRYAATALYGRSLYIIGGNDRTRDLGLVEAVDLDRLTVEKMPPLEPARRWATAVVHQDRIWVIGGAIGEERIARTDIFDPRTKAWSRGPDLGAARDTRAFVAKGTIWVLGGYAGKRREVVRSIERLRDGRFEVAGEMSMPTSAFSAEVVDDRWVYTFGDYTDLERVMRLDLDSLTWSAVEPGYTPRRHTASTQVGRTLIVFGGNVKTDGSSLDLAESFEERCGEAPSPLREPHRRLDTVRIASETMVRQMLGAPAGSPISVLERPDHFFTERSRPPEGLDREEHRALTTVWQELNLLTKRGPIPFGLYDPRVREIVLSSKGAAPEVVHSTLSHEMVHAVRHKMGHYERVLDIDPHEVDRWLASRALVEGDATLFGSIASMAQERGVSPSRMVAVLKQKPKLPDELLETINESLRGNTDRRAMPYERGVLFVLHLMSTDGVEALKRAFSDPPRSTEQILHPEKYLLERDEPQTVALAASEGWNVAWSGTLGEFDLLHFLSKVIGFDRAASAAAGWDGGRIALLESKEGSKIWSKTVWDTEADAVEFAHAWSEAAERKGRPADVQRRGAAVTVTERLAVPSAP